MAARIRSVIDSDNVPVIVGGVLVDINQTINVGDLVQIDPTSHKLKVGVAASTTLVGYANEAIATGGTVTSANAISITLLKAQVVRMSFYTAGTKTSFSQTDLYTIAFDLYDKVSINPDDTTGGMCYLVGYDNTLKTVDVIFADANLAAIG